MKNFELNRKGGSLNNLSPVTIIEPIKKTKVIDKERVKVAVYCRVSSAMLADSIESQLKFFDDLLKSHINWELEGEYVDYAKSGTTTKNRDEFNKMIRKCKNGEIDIICCKEVSRFSRNLRETLSIVEELKNQNIFVFFASDDIYTEDPEGMEDLIDVSRQAEKESKRTSRRVRFGQSVRMSHGVVFGRKEMYGYRIKRDETGNQYFEIQEDEAEVVQWIFERYKLGDGCHSIAKKLREQGIPSLRSQKWTNTSILRLLRNEKYAGKLLQGKTFTPDPMTHKKKYNKGEARTYFSEYHHKDEAIITEELWNEVQERLQKNTIDEETKLKHSNRYWCSGKIFCGACGGRYVPRYKRLKGYDYTKSEEENRDFVSKSWICQENNRNGKKKNVQFGEAQIQVGCDNGSLSERTLQQAVIDLVSYTQLNSEQIKNDIISEINEIKIDKPNQNKLKKLEESLEKYKAAKSMAINEHLLGELMDGDYRQSLKHFEMLIEETEVEIRKFNEFDLEKSLKISERKGVIKLIDDMLNLTPQNQFSEAQFNKILKQVIVFPNHILKVELTFLPAVFMKYETRGRKENYTSIFRIIDNQEEINRIINSD